MFYNESYSIYVVDGQNESDIMKYIALLNDSETQLYDPCIPYPFTSWQNIVIEFDAHYINDIRDWYPYYLCDESNISYYNQYIFDGARSLELHNLIINDYVITSNDSHHLFARSKPSTKYYSSLACYNCTFMNITSTLISSDDTDEKDRNSGYELFDFRSSISLIDTQFINLSIASIMINIEAIDGDNQNRRTLNIQNCLFQDIDSTDSMIFLPFQEFDQFVPPHLEIIDAVFEDIAVYDDEYIILDYCAKSSLLISNSTIDIISGLIYYNAHSVKSNISISNSIISSNQFRTIDDDSLFEFKGLDVVFIEATTILYSYDVQEGCFWGYPYGPYVNSVINKSYRNIYCLNPIQAIRNDGEMFIKDLTIDMVISGNHPYSTSSLGVDYLKLIYYSPSSSVETALILNGGIMNMMHINIKHPICDNMILNNAELSITNLSFDAFFIANRDPNYLQSARYIVSDGNDLSSLLITKSHFYGGLIHIYVSYGNIVISHSIFEYCFVPIRVAYSSQFLMHDSRIQNVGWYYSGITNDFIQYENTFFFRSFDNQQIQFLNNVISGYAPGGFLSSSGNGDVFIINNSFTYNSSNQYYPAIIGPYDYFVRTMFFSDNYGEIKLIGNYFGYNIIDSTKPWIYSQDDNMCFTGNTFIGSAFRGVRTELTSCFRSQLIECMTLNDTSCSDDRVVYGEMDLSLIDETGYFIVDNEWEIDFVMKSADGGNIALDNINITVINNDNVSDNPLLFLNYENEFLLIDSYISTNYDILYEANVCNVSKNERLSNQTEYISKLSMKCAPWNNLSDVDGTMKSENTKLIDHLSAVEINITTKSDTYYPGELEQITFNVMDKLGNVVPYKQESQDTIISLTGKFFANDIIINEIGECRNCEIGILINTVTIRENLNDVYSINVSITDNILYLTNKQIYLQIIGCPSGYGPDSNNASCIQCDTDSYKLLNDDIGECKSCDPKNNDGVECSDGKITLLQDYWMGFNNDTIISSICPSGHCCQDIGGCYYINNEQDNAVGGAEEQSLCAVNRDPTIPLCGKCMDGYSESMNNSNCVKCEDEYHFEYLLYPFTSAALLVAFLFVLSRERAMPDPKKLNDRDISAKESVDDSVSKVTFWKQLAKNVYFQRMIRTMLLKNIFYYEQAVSEIISISTYKILFRWIAYYFSFSLTSLVSYADGDGWCFVDGLDGKGKVLVDLLVPIMTFLIISIRFLWNKLCICRFECRGKPVNWTKAYILTYLILIGKVLDVLFRIMSCQKVGDEVVHFYFGEEECYGVSWFSALIALLIVICSFTLIAVKLYSMTPEERQNENHPFNRFVAIFKPQYYYWEYVIFIRRIVITVFAVSVQDHTLQFVFLVILVFFLFLQYKCDPFVVNENNEMEYILLACLVCIQAIQISASFDPLTVNILISILIILPLPLLIYYIRHIYKHHIVGNAKKLNDHIDVNIKFDDDDDDIMSPSSVTFAGNDAGAMRPGHKVSEDKIGVVYDQANGRNVYHNYGRTASSKPVVVEMGGFSGK